jgi:cyclohexyl-isocyanide hydratase
MTQLMLEYDPQPPFRAGTPATAGADLTRLVIGLLQNSDESVESLVATARRLRAARPLTA